MNSDYIKKHFLTHQILWVAIGLSLWLGLNVVVLSTNYLMEARANNQSMTIWEPFTWEISSVLVMFLLAAVLFALMRTVLCRFTIKQQLLIHVLITLPFSALHIIGMVSIREVVYLFMGGDYQFGGWLNGLIYEYRKDFMTYCSLVFVFHAYQIFVLRLQGEAKYVHTGETSVANLYPKQLLVKKLGKEFLVPVDSIEWVEASGNYANIHIDNSVYPMRITMSKLEALLPSAQFFRIHRSTIVNLNHVKHIEPVDSGDHLLTLVNGVALNFSRRYREQFKVALNYSSGQGLTSEDHIFQ